MGANWRSEDAIKDHVSCDAWHKVALVRRSIWERKLLLGYDDGLQNLSSGLEPDPLFSLNWAERARMTQHAPLAIRSLSTPSVAHHNTSKQAYLPLHIYSAHLFTLLFIPPSSPPFPAPRESHHHSSNLGQSLYKIHIHSSLLSLPSIPPSIMCREITEGTRYACNHYVPTFWAAIWDCNKAQCSKSQRHPQQCRSASCIAAYGPDMENVKEISEKACPQCRR